MERRRYDVPLPTGRLLRFGERTLVMGVLNVTPDSFSDGGRFENAGAAVDQALEMAEAGADVIDVGGESTRPGAASVPADDERSRVLPVIRALARQVRVPVSIDTSKADVARAALDAGASMINDVSGLRYEPDLARVAADGRVPLVLMHTRGRPAEMYRFAAYESVVDDVARELAQSIDVALAAGVSRDALIVDPGLGFAKRAGQSLELLARLDAAPLLALDRPLAIGPSRKSFLTSATGELPPADRDWATAAAVTAAILLGAHMVRVHRVREMVQAARLADLLRTWRLGAGA